MGRILFHNKIQIIRSQFNNTMIRFQVIGWVIGGNTDKIRESL